MSTGDDLVVVAEMIGADLSDDALIYAGSATCDMWQAHVVNAVAAAWLSLPPVARAVAFLQAKSRTE